MSGGTCRARTSRCSFENCYSLYLDVVVIIAVIVIVIVATGFRVRVIISLIVVFVFFFFFLFFLIFRDVDLLPLSGCRLINL